MNRLLQRILKEPALSVIALMCFIFPFLYTGALVYPFVVPRALIFFLFIHVLSLFLIWKNAKSLKIIIPKGWIVYGIITYLLVIIISSIFGADFINSFWSGYGRMTGIITILHFLMFAYILTISIPKDKWLIYIFRPLIFSGGLIALISIGSVAGLDLQFLSFLEHPGGFFGNTTFSGAYISIIFFIGAVSFFLEKNIVWKKIYSAVLFLLLISPEILNFKFLQGQISLSQIINNPAVLLGAARASGVALFVGLFLIVIFYYLNQFISSRKKIITISSILIVITLILPIFFIGSIVAEKGLGNNLVQEFKDYNRQLVWQQSIGAIRQKPLLGYGYENFQYAFQTNYNAKLIGLRGEGAWFDKPHNVYLQVLTETGVIGFLAFASVFLAILFVCLHLFLRKKSFVYLIFPIIFLVHVLQMQTSFETMPTLFLIFILLSYGVSQENKTVVLKISSQTKQYFMWIGSIILVATFIWAFLNPIQNNKLVTKFFTYETLEERFIVYNKLQLANINPLESLKEMTQNHFTTVFTHIDAIEDQGLIPQVARENEVILNTYNSLYPRFKDNYRFLISFANLIQISTPFGVGAFEQSSILAEEAVAISNRYPQAYWILSLNAHYRGDDDEARNLAKKALDLNPQLLQSQQVQAFINQNEIRIFLLDL